MNKEMRDILAEIEAKTGEAKKAFAAGETEKASGFMAEVDELQKKYELAEKIFIAEQKFAGNPGTGKPAGEPNSEKSFANAARHLFKTMDESTSGDPSAGAYTVPQDIQTKINTFRDAKFSLRSLVRVEPVKTLTGSRIFQVKAAQSAWGVVGEGAAAGVKATPTFTRKTYSIKKYGGIFPVTNELLADSDAAITQTIVEWIGDGSRVTGNGLVLAAVATKAQTNLTNLNGIKTALIKTLGQAYMSSSAIVTNDDGLLYLDTLEDGVGRPALKLDPSNPLNMWLAVGSIRIPIKVLPNADLATSNSKVPFIIGDLMEAIWFFDRNQTTIKMSDTAVVGAGTESEINAFEDDVSLFRALEREDVSVRDASAFVNGYITVS